MAIDYVVPVSVCKNLALADDWTHDASNRVLACAACNGFGNRYRQAADTECPTSLEGFYDLRDRIFAERSVSIARRRAEERAFYERRLWLDGE